MIANQTVYSPCKICNQPGQRTPLWQVKAERVVYDQVKHRIHFTDATVDVLGVPVLYTPVLTEPDPTVKYASGLLAPDVGNSTKIGYFARLPCLYRAVAHQRSDAWRRNSPPRAASCWRRNIAPAGTIAACGCRARSPTIPMAGWAGTAGRRRFYDHLFGSGRFSLDDSWRTGFDAQLTNNTAYMRFYDISYPRPAGERSVRRGRHRPQPLRAHRLLFPGPALHRRAAHHPLCAAASWITPTFPTSKVAGGQLPLRSQQRLAGPQRRPRQPALHQRSELAACP